LKYYFEKNLKNDFEEDIKNDYEKNSKTLTINYLISISAFIIGIPYLKLQKFFLLLGINFISEQTFFKHINKILPKIKPITEKCLNHQREMFANCILRILNLKIIKKFEYENKNNKQLNEKQILEKNKFLDSLRLPYEILALIYSFMFDSFYIFGSYDGRYDKRRGASNCTVFLFELYLTKKILFFSNASKISLRTKYNKNKYKLSSNMLEQ
jgi:hypothetical protein